MCLSAIPGACGERGKFRHCKTTACSRTGFDSPPSPAAVHVTPSKFGDNPVRPFLISFSMAREIAPSYCWRPRLLSQAPTSMIRSYVQDGDKSPRSKCKSRQDAPRWAAFCLTGPITDPSGHQVSDSNHQAGRVARGPASPRSRGDTSFAPLSSKICARIACRSPAGPELLRMRRCIFLISEWLNFDMRATMPFSSTIDRGSL